MAPHQCHDFHTAHPSSTKCKSMTMTEERGRFRRGRFDGEETYKQRDWLHIPKNVEGALVINLYEAVHPLRALKMDGRHLIALARQLSEDSSKAEVICTESFLNSPSSGITPETLSAAENDLKHLLLYQGRNVYSPEEHTQLPCYDLGTETMPTKALFLRYDAGLFVAFKYLARCLRFTGGEGITVFSVPRWKLPQFRPQLKNVHLWCMKQEGACRGSAAWKCKHNGRKVIVESASILPFYVTPDREVHFLFGQQYNVSKDRSVNATFGGKRLLKVDKDPIDTAVREWNEEMVCLLEKIDTNYPKEVADWIRGELKFPSKKTFPASSKNILATLYVFPHAIGDLKTRACLQLYIRLPERLVNCIAQRYPPSNGIDVAEATDMFHQDAYESGLLCPWEVQSAQEFSRNGGVPCSETNRLQWVRYTDVNTLTQSIPLGYNVSLALREDREELEQFLSRIEYNDE